MALQLVDSGPPGSPRLPGRSEARSREELFRRTCAVVFEMAPAWGSTGAAIVVAAPPLNQAAVQSAFDEISEKYGVTGIDLHFADEDGRRLHAIFSPSSRGDAAA